MKGLSNASSLLYSMTEMGVTKIAISAKRTRGNVNHLGATFHQLITIRLVDLLWKVSLIRPEQAVQHHRRPEGPRYCRL